MAPAKKPKSAPKKATPRKKPVRKTDDALPILKANEEALKKLRSLQIEQGLQNDIQWCLGSFAYDRNPVGLFEMGARALKIFKDLKSINPKSVPATLVKNLEKALAG